MTTLTNLKVKCTICGKEEIVSSKLTSEISDIVNKFNMKPDKYLNLLNIMYGKCLDSDEHSFVFTEEFKNRIEEIVVQHKNILAEIELTKNTNSNYLKEISEFKLKVNENEAKIKANESRIINLNTEISELQNEIGNAVGIYKIDNWY